MKKVFYLLLLLVASCTSYSQAPLGNKKSIVYALNLIGADSGIVFKSCIVDTTAANRGYLDTLPGVMFRDCSNNIWQRSGNARFWIRLKDTLRVLPPLVIIDSSNGYKYLKDTASATGAASTDSLHQVLERGNSSTLGMTLNRALTKFFAGGYGTNYSGIWFGDGPHDFTGTGVVGDNMGNLFHFATNKLQYDVGGFTMIQSANGLSLVPYNYASNSALFLPATSSTRVPIRYQLGADSLTSPVAGAIEPTNTNLYFTTADGVRHSLLSRINGIKQIGNSPNKFGASLIQDSLVLQPANADYPGIISAEAQEFTGNKTFLGNTYIAGTLDVGDNAYYNANVAFSVNSSRLNLFNMYDASANPLFTLKQTGRIGISNYVPEAKLHIKTYGIGTGQQDSSGIILDNPKQATSNSDLQNSPAIVWRGSSFVRGTTNTPVFPTHVPLVVPSDWRAYVKADSNYNGNAEKSKWVLEHKYAQRLYPSLALDSNWTEKFSVDYSGRITANFLTLYSDATVAGNISANSITTNSITAGNINAYNYALSGNTGDAGQFLMATGGGGQTWGSTDTVAANPGAFQTHYQANGTLGNVYRYKALMGQQTAATGITTGSLTVGQVYTIDTYNSGDDFSNMALISGTINTTGAIFQAINADPISWAAASSLSHTNLPYFVVLQNTLPGTISYTYNGVGDYSFHIDDIFLETKTIVTIGPGFYYAGTGYTYTYYANRADNSNIHIQTGTETVGVSLVDDAFPRLVPITIEIYP